MSVEKFQKIEAKPVLSVVGGKKRRKQVFETINSKRGQTL